MRRRRLAWGLAVVDLMIVIASSVVDPEPDFVTIVLFVLGIASFVLMGVLLVSRVPTNPIGGLLLAAGSFVVAQIAIGTYADLGALQVPPWPGSALARTVGDALLYYPVLIALVGVSLVFPDGRLPSPRFRWVVLFMIVCMIAWMIGAVFDTEEVGPVVLVSTLVSFGGAATAITLRFRRGDPVQRQQVKWLAAVVLLAAIVFPTGFLLFNDFYDLSVALNIIGVAALFALPVVIGVAILRYRLYDIDRIISRTVSWAVVTGTLAAVFAGAVILLQAALVGFTQGQTLAVAASTLVAFALFQPIRRRVQAAVDRRFDRARYDADQTVRSFATRLRGDLDMGTVRSEIIGTATSAVRPTKAAVWLRGTER